MNEARDWLQRGLQAHRGGERAEAEACYQRAIDLADDADAWHMLGMLRHQAGESAEALACLQQALRQRSGDPAILANRAAVHLALNNAEQARQDANLAAQANPGLYAAWFNLGLALEALSKWDEALIALERAHALRSSDATRLPRQRCAAALARAYGLGGRPHAALQAWKNYFELGGDAADAWLMRANAAGDLGRHAENLDYLAEARRSAPNAADYASAELIAQCYQSTTDAQSQWEQACAWAQSFCADAPIRAAAQQRHVPRRIGFYSPRFAAGPVASLGLPLLQALCARGIDVYLYAGFDYVDRDTARFRSITPFWRDCHSCSDAELVRQAHSDELDVMVDLCGHAPGNRLRAFAQRMAPLQLSWGDWFATTGLPNMDVFFGDSVLTPEHEDRWFSERVERLPDTRFVYAPPPEFENNRSPERRREGPPRFGSFNRLSKLSADTIACWARILVEVPESTLKIRAAALEENETASALLRRFSALGVAPHRLVFAGFGSYAEVLSDYAGIDIALDPFPFNGCVTSCDALWMGIPVVALAGRCLVARQGASLLTAHGCSDWIARDVDGYVDIASRLAESEASLRNERERLEQARRHSVLFDADRFTDAWLAGLGKAYSS